MGKKRRAPRVRAAPTEFEKEHPELLAENRKKQLQEQAATTRMEVEQMNELEIPPQQGIENVIEFSDTGPAFEGGISVVPPMVSETASPDSDTLTAELLSEETADKVFSGIRRTSAPRGRPKGYKKNSETGEWEQTQPKETVFQTVRRRVIGREPKPESSNSGIAKRVSQRGQKLLVKSTAIVAGFTDPPIAMTPQEAYDIVDPFASWLARQPIIENPVLRKAVDNFELGEVGLGIADYLARVIREENEIVKQRRADESAREEYIRASRPRESTIAETIQSNPRVRQQSTSTEEQRGSVLAEDVSSSDIRNGNGIQARFEPKIPQTPGV